MASREGEKRRRRDARLAAERQAAASARRQRMLRWGGAAVLAVALIVAVGVAISSGGGSGGRGSAATDASGKPVALPAPKETHLKAAARPAGCVLRNVPSFGQEHTTDQVTYKSNPPTSGTHNRQPAQDGAYRPGNPPEAGQAVPTLQHGRIALQWKPGASQPTIGQLRSLFDERGGYHALRFEDQTNLPSALAATAWAHLIGCNRVTPATSDALRDFRKAYTDKGPERVP